MSCSNCKEQKCVGCTDSYKIPNRNSCEESKLNLGLSQDGSMLVGALNGVPISPVRLDMAVDNLETVTEMYFSPEQNGIVFVNEDGNENIITIAEILNNATIEEIAGIGDLEEGGLASVVRRDGILQLTLEVPPILPSSQNAQGFVVYVPNVGPGEPHYKLIAPQSGASNSVMVGSPDGSIQFVQAISSPRPLNGNNMDDGGTFSGTPAVSTNGVVRSRMGNAMDIVNSDPNPIEVSLEFFMQFTADGAQGAYARLESGGGNFVTDFVEGVNGIDRPLGRGGYGKWTVVLGPGQAARFVFGVWSAGQSVNCVIGNLTSGAPRVIYPVIYAKRLM